jgi:hypothetical protein
MRQKKRKIVVLGGLGLTRRYGGRPDVPEMATCGETTGEVIEQAEDALVSALSFYVGGNRAHRFPHLPTAARSCASPSWKQRNSPFMTRCCRPKCPTSSWRTVMGIDEKAIRRLRVW